MVKTRNIAIIPARGGSKRIPKKNIVDFFGRPMIAWTIAAAQKSQLFDRILVSTDDPEIAQVAKDLGLEIPFLRDKDFDDHASVSQATITALQQVKLKLKEEYDNVIQLMPNCPLRNETHITEAYKNFLENNAKFQISCCKFGWLNPWWAVTLDKAGHPAPQFPEALKKRSQDLTPMYCPTGAIWIARYPELIQGSSFYGAGHIFHPLEWQAAVDIDDPADLEMAKTLYAIQNKGSLHV